jgi:hypothetical protein
MKKMIEHYYETVPRKKDRFVPIFERRKRAGGEEGSEGPIDLTRFGIEDYEDHPDIAVRWRISTVYRDKKNGSRIRQALEGNIPTTKKPPESMIAKGDLTPSERYEFDFVWSQLDHLYTLYKELGKNLTIMAKAERTVNQRLVKMIKQSDFRKHLIEDFNAKAGEASIDPDTVLKSKSNKKPTQEFYEDP